MRIVIAPDKFKGSLSAEQVCAAIAHSIRNFDSSIEIDSIPMADGGEGTVAALVSAAGGRFITRRVTGPLPEMKVDATFGLIESDGSTTAVIEMAAASGLALLKPEDRDPLATTTFGTGQLMRIAIQEFGVTKIIVGLGGSATIDGGIGAAQACGLPVLLDGGEPTSDAEPLCGRDLDRVVRVKHGRGDRIGGVEIIGACDVTNPLFGENGAARIFGKQKGANEESIAWLDAKLKSLAHRTGHDDLAQIVGAGAAGGMGFGLAAFFGATLTRGAAVVINAVKLRERLRGSDLCITGEGKIDAQTLAGKTVFAVAELCENIGIRCVAIAGEIDSVAVNDLKSHGLIDAIALNEILHENENSIRDVETLIERASIEILLRLESMDS